MQEDLIKQKQLANLQSVWILAIASTTAAAIVVAITLYGTASNTRLFIWLAFAFIMSCCRFFSGLAYKYLETKLFSYEKWINLYTGLLLFYGCVWGSAFFLLDNNMSTTQYLTVWIVVTFILAGASAIYATRLSHFFSMAMPILTLCIASMFFNTIPDYGLFVFMFAIFWGFMTSNALRVNEKENRLITNEIELEALNKKLQGLALRDPLTNLMNRRAFDEYYESEWQRHSRSAGVLSVILIDIDYFKQYNDHYGHDAGDKVLIRFANVLNKSLLRPADIAVRYGGEEFLLLLPDTTIQGAIEVSERIRDLLTELNIENITSEKFQRITVSMGIETVDPTNDKEPKDVIIDADKKLYQAKHAGRDQVCFQLEAV